MVLQDRLVFYLVAAILILKLLMVTAVGVAIVAFVLDVSVTAFRRKGR